jgi:magnesium transporter
MTNTLYLPELREMLAQNDIAELREFTVALHPARTAEFMEGLTADEAWRVLQHADSEIRAQNFLYFERPKQVEIVEQQSRGEIGQFIADLPADDRVDILKSVDPAIVEELLPFVPAIDRRDILRLQSYPEGTAGAMMTTDFAKLPEGLTVKQALDEIAKQAEGLETIYYMFIVDQEDHLRGVVSARQLVSGLSKLNMPIKNLMENELITVGVGEDQEEVTQKVAQYDLHAIPVVDDEYHMLGIITHDDVIDVVQQEATEDVHRLGGVGHLEESYLEAKFTTIWRKRALWLSCLFGAELLTYTALVRFKHTIDSVTILALFVPLCISTGGNSGSQAATLITRAMALGQVTLRDWWSVLRHELLMGLALGATLGFIGFLRTYLFTSKTDLDGIDPFIFAMVIAQAVTAICLWGTIVGSMLPIVFKRMGIDPGYASSPFVATFVDVTGIVIYFSIAKMYILT